MPLNARVRLPDFATEYAPTLKRWERITGRPIPHHLDGRGVLAPAFVEWVMGLEPGWVTDVPGVGRNEALRAFGNGVVPAQAEWAITNMLGHGHG